jgi:hypothetical protein
MNNKDYIIRHITIFLNDLMLFKSGKKVEIESFSLRHFGILFSDLINGDLDEQIKKYDLYNIEAIIEMFLYSIENEIISPEDKRQLILKTDKLIKFYENQSQVQNLKFLIRMNTLKNV